MNINLPLTPHLEQFVREQLASGHFQTEADMVRAALRLLEEHFQESKATEGKPPLDQGLASTSSEPASRGFGATIRVGLRSDLLPGNEPAAIPSARRSPRGILADIRSYISPDDIKEVRSEMWSGLRHGEA